MIFIAVSFWNKPEDRSSLGSITRMWEIGWLVRKLLCVAFTQPSYNELV